VIARSGQRIFAAAVTPAPLEPTISPSDLCAPAFTLRAD
jgi:hypothetical protein